MMSVSVSADPFENEVHNALQRSSAGRSGAMAQNDRLGLFVGLTQAFLGKNHRILCFFQSARDSFSSVIGQQPLPIY